MKSIAGPSQHCPKLASRKDFAPRRSSRVLLAALTAMTLPALPVVAAPPSTHSVAGPDSAIGAAYVTSVVISPAFQQTGTVVVLATQVRCKHDCFPIWLSHDGGATWHRSPITRFQPTALVIAVDDHHHETFFGGTSKVLMRSDDGGEHWTSIGTGGRPTLLPTSSSDRRVVIAEASGPADYVWHNTVVDDVAGSGGREQDMQFMLSPTYPDGGAFSPVLLLAINSTTGRPDLLDCTVQFECSHPRPLSGLVVPSGISGTLLYPAEDYAQHGTVFANTTAGVFKSTDGGRTFAPLAVAPAAGTLVSTTPMFDLAPGYRESGPVRTAYVAVSQIASSANGQLAPRGGIYRTLDGGRTWTPLATNGLFASGATAVAEAPDGRLFAGYFTADGNGGLSCSTDGGATWRPTCPPTVHHALAGVSVTGAGASAGGPSRAVLFGLIGVIATVLGLVLARTRRNLRPRTVRES